MIGLSEDIEVSINIILEGLGYDLVVANVTPEKMKKVMDAKKESFIEAKTLLNEWVNSANRPSDKKILQYATKLVTQGDASIIKLRKALRSPIDYDELSPEKHGIAIKSKTVILQTIRMINSSLSELRLQITSNNVKFKEEDFKIGWAERFANGDFYPEKDYHKKWYNKELDSVMICPFGTVGKTIVIENLNITLPKRPPKKNIKYSGFKKENQYWRREEMPEGLTPSSSESFTDYILEQFRLRREGLWFMNNGEAVYLPGSFWFALQWGKMLDDGDYMDFRYAQLDIIYHQEACLRDKRCFGELFLKSRRTGFTFLVILAKHLEESTRKKNGRYGITSKSQNDVDEVFKKFSYAYLELPFFFQPVVKGKVESSEKLFFGKPADMTKAAKLAKETSTKDYLNTEIDTRSTKDDSYDSAKLNGYLGDEAGKWKRPQNYINHLGTIKPTMVPNGRVIGKAWIGSTVGKLNQGGANFRTIDGMSNVNERIALTGMTTSGLYSFFLPAYKNQEICTDKYGKCWEQTPPKGTLDRFGEEIKFGSIEFLKSLEEAAMSNPDSTVLNAHYRAEPSSREQAYRDSSEECQFNINKLYEQEDYNNSIEEAQRYTVGNFSWEDGIRDSEVRFDPSKNGRFKIAWLPSMVDDTEGIRNNVNKIGNKFYPMNSFGYFSSDPFSVRAAVGGKGSSGAIHGFCSENTGNLQKYDCFLEYLCRPRTEDIFFEDVVMAIHFYGLPILAELNRVDLLRYIRNRGYRPFSINRLDKNTKDLSAHEKEYGGQQLSGVSILDDHLSAINWYIENHIGAAGKNNPYRAEGEIGRFPFNETIEDWKIFNPDKRTKHDASISSGLGIMAVNKNKYKPKKKEETIVDINKLFPTYKN